MGVCRLVDVILAASPPSSRRRAGVQDRHFCASFLVSRVGESVETDTAMGKRRLEVVQEEAEVVDRWRWRWRWK